MAAALLLALVTTMNPARAADDETQRVAYDGLQIDVPSDWVVVHLDAAPTTCVRFDRHVLYLGAPGSDQACPAGVVGRTEAVLVQPRPVADDGAAVSLAAGEAPRLSSVAETAGEVSVDVQGSELRVTATFGMAPEVALAVLRSAAVDRTAARAEALPPPGDPPASLVPEVLPGWATTYAGYGFDACTAPSLAAMRGWLASSYRAVGVYIGGASRGCAQPNLTAGWMASVVELGYRPMPLYVGLQAPCSNYTNRIVPGQEAVLGDAAASDAVIRARALGLGAGSAITFDMESYPRGGDCSTSVMAFLSAWSAGVEARGFGSGVYSSAATGIADIVASVGRPGFRPPSTLWIARWDGVATTHDPVVPDELWVRARTKQYQGPHDESYGGATINIDSNVVDTSGWYSLGGSTSAEPGAAGTGDDISVAVRGDDAQVWQRSARPDGPGWAPLGGLTDFGPALSSWGGGRLDVTVTGLDGGAWHKSREAGWSGYESLGGVLRSGPAAVSDAVGSLDVFGRGADDALWQVSYAGGWSGWSSLGGSVLSSPAAASRGTGLIDVVARGADSAVWHMSYDPYRGWGTWESLGGLTPSSPAVVAMPGGRLGVYATGPDGVVYGRSWTGAQWSAAWVLLGGPATSGPTAARDGYGVVQLFVRGPGNATWRSLQS